MSSPNFELLTTAGSSDARRTVEYFEQVRGFFVQGRDVKVDTKLPVTIVLFRNEKEFKPYSTNEVAIAYYVGDNSRDYIVMGHTGNQVRPTAVHEYIHLLLRRLDINVPIWLNEGMAEVYSTISPLANKIAVGAVPEGRAWALQDKWLPLTTVLSVGYKSPEYNKKQHAGMFYAQSWMLVHMLMLGHDYRSGFSKFLAMVIEDGTAEGCASAFEKVYGKSPGEVEKDLAAYYRSGARKVAVFDTRFEKIGGLEPASAEEFTVDLHLARILAASGRAKKLRVVSNALLHNSQTGGKPTTLSPMCTGAEVVWSRREMSSARLSG